MSIADAGAVAALNREMQYHADEARVAARFVAISSQPGNALYVADSQGAVLGWAHVRIVELLQLEPYAALVGLAVRADARRQRIGGQLVAACRSWALERGHAGVRLA